MLAKYISTLACLLLTTTAYAANQTIQFSNACTPGKNLRIAAVGDILLHAPLQIKSADSGFISMWQVSLPYVESADIAYANLEGPMAEGINQAGRQVDDPGHQYDNHVYTSFPLFNYHPKLAQALKQSGFDIVSTANNHSLDRYGIGVDKTIDALNRQGINYVGTRHKNADKPWVKVINKDGFSVAWLACTENTNGIDDKFGQVLYCFKKQDRKEIISSIKALKNNVDIIIVSPHWGVQYNHQHSRAQRRFAHQVLDAGATAVIGSHPHVLQAMEKYQTKDNRETFILYSLGNFVSYQGTLKNRTTVVLLLDFVKTQKGSFIKAVNFVPMYMQNRQGQERIRLTAISKQSTSLPHDIVASVLPMGNAVYSLEELNANSCE